MATTSQAQHHMEDCCDICGDIGVANALMTCSRCKIYTEHTYCLRTPIAKPIDDWICEECESNSKRKQLASCELPCVSKTKMQSGYGEKKVERGKTKFIPPKEAIMLSAGEKLSNLPPLRIGTYKVERTPVRPRTVPVSSQQYLASGPSQQPNPNRLGKMEICERQLQQSDKLTGGNDHNNTKLRIGDADNMNNNILLDLEKCLFAPALDALWRGSFSIQGDHGHGEMNHQIQAHPPSKVRRKVHEFSKRMPDVLHFQLVPARISWINLFKECVPDERDIALYFFPIVGERSEDYISLLESISLKNLALRQQIADVELLVFTSKLLPLNSQCWEGKYFLWGVFHRMKRDTIACSDNRVLLLPPSGDASLAHHQVGDSKECDMDIDMIGGVNVGRMDIPVRRQLVRS